MSGVLWPKSNQIEWDANGIIADGALAYFYEPGTTTPRPVYQDADLTTPHEHPVEASGSGRWPAIFVGYGAYKEVATTAGGSQLWATDDIPNPAPFTDDFELDETTILTTGDVFAGLKNNTRTGAVRLNGRTIGNASSGATERANADTSDLFAYLWNNLANAQAAVSGGRGSTAAADFAANKTIALPDARGCGLVGFDDMGNTAASLLGSAPVVSGGPTTTGSILGANTHTLSATEMPSHTHTATTSSNGAHTHTATTSSNGAHTHSGTTSVENGPHTHTLAYTASTAASGGGVFVVSTFAASASTSTDIQSIQHTHTYTTDSQGAHTHTLTTSSDGAHTHTLTTASAGSGGAHNNLARSLTVTWFIKL